MQDNWFENMEKLAQDLLEQMPKDHQLYMTADRKVRITLPKALGIQPGD